MQFSYPVRAFLRAVVSDEPVFQIAHQAIVDILMTLTLDKWKCNENDCQQKISFYGSLIYNLILSAERCSFTLPQSFWELINQLATLSKGFIYFLVWFSLLVCYVFEKKTKIKYSVLFFEKKRK